MVFGNPRGNPFLAELVKALSGRYSVEAAGMTTGQWICANTTRAGAPFSFRGYGFQRAIADDLHPELDVLKISQVGLTEVQIRKTLAFLVRNPGTTAIFSLPNEIMYRRFSQSRLQPLLNGDRVFAPAAEDVRSMSLVQLGRSFLHVVNATEGSATSTPADAVFVDEVDLSDQKVLALYASRLQNSGWRIKQRFSTPTWTGFGIDAGYAASDQREYMIRCRACNHWQVPLFDRRWVDLPGLRSEAPLHDLDDATILALDLGAAQVVCERCRAPLDLDDDEAREWVAAHPSRRGRGYRVRPFSSSRIGVAYILEQLLAYRRRDFVRGWWNTVLGEPYSDARARLDETAIRACFGSPVVAPPPAGTPVGLGVDVGQVCHLVLGTPTPDGVRAFEFRQVRAADLVDTVREIAATHNLVCGACDRHPYTPTAEELFAVTGGRVVPVEYRGDKDFDPVLDEIEGQVRHWRANRTRMMDAVARAVRLGTLRMEGFGLQGGLLVDHLRDMIREEHPEKPAAWVKLTGNDHYFHALAFLLAGFRIRQVGGSGEIRSVVAVGAAALAAPPALAGHAPAPHRLGFR